MQDLTAQEQEEINRKADLEKWEIKKKELEEKFTNEELPKIASELDADYRRRRDGYNRLEIDRRNSPSLHPSDELTERSVVTKQDYDDVLERAKNRANREVEQIIDQSKIEYLEKEQKTFFKEQEEARKLLAEQQKLDWSNQAGQYKELKQIQALQTAADLMQEVEDRHLNDALNQEQGKGLGRK